MSLTIIIVSFNTKQLLKSCLQSIFQKKWKNEIKVVVVDNASIDGSDEMVEKDFPRVNLIRSKINTGFAGGNNLGLKAISANLYLLLNSDTKVLDDSLDNLVDFMASSDFGIGSCKLLNKDRSLQPNAGSLPFGWPLFFWLAGWDDIVPVIGSKLPSFHQKYSQFYQGDHEVGWVSGSAMVIKKEVVDKIGLLDQSIFMYGEDAEYCFRAKRAGFKVGWTNQAQIIHLGGGSSHDPSYKQWVGEFRGLLYIYGKYFGFLSQVFLRLLIYLFVLIRMAVFLIIGKVKVSTTYAKVLFNL